MTDDTGHERRMTSVARSPATGTSKLRCPNSGTREAKPTDGQKQLLYASAKLMPPMVATSSRDNCGAMTQMCGLPADGATDHEARGRRQQWGLLAAVVLETTTRPDPTRPDLAVDNAQECTAIESILSCAVAETRSRRCASGCAASQATCATSHRPPSDHMARGRQLEQAETIPEHKNAFCVHQTSVRPQD